MKEQIERIVTAAQKLGRLHQVTFALACAQRVAPVVSQLSRQGILGVYDNAMQEAWGALMAPTSTADLEQHLNAIDELPEARADDSLKPDYYVMIALYPLGVALRLLAQDAAEDSLRSAAFTNFNLCAEIDSDDEIHFVTHDQALKHGSLEMAELAAQLATLQTLQNAPTLDRGTYERLRQQAIEVSLTVGRAIPRFALNRGWVLKCR